VKTMERMASSDGGRRVEFFFVVRTVESRMECRLDDGPGIVQ